MAISGIPTSRVSDLFIRERLLGQVQSDQGDLYNIQMQLSTGYRYQLPSEDPVSAMQVVGLQRLLERKAQVQTNVKTNQSFLTATDSALSGVSNVASEARGLALSVIGTTASDTEREAAAQQIGQIIKQMFDAGNQKFRGRYLFAGTSTAVSPFEMTSGGYVDYQGNEGRLSSYADTDLLFDTNLTGSEAFGAVSAEVKGAELQPALTYDTSLADLHNGKGIGIGAIELSDGTHSVKVDISKAATIGDVAAMIRKTGGELSDTEWVTADVSPQGLVVELHNIDGSPASPLTIRDVGGGTAAYDLGILKEESLSPVVVGEALDPALRNTRSVHDILGARSVAFLHSVGSDNDLIIRADANGDRNGIRVVVADDPTVAQGHETVTLAGSTLTIRIDEGETTAQDVVAAFEKYYDPETMPFTAELDSQDVVSDGTGPISVTDPANPILTAYGWGEELDLEHGMKIDNGDQQSTIHLSGVQSVGELLNAINGQGAGLLAEINDTASGINIRSRYSGADFSIGENGGETARQLGVRSFTSKTRLEDLNFGRGVVDYQGTGSTASATASWVGSHNDLIFRSRQTGSEWNGYQISFEDNLPAGNEGITYDTINHRIHVEVNPGETTANDVLHWAQNNSDVRQDFDVSLDPEDGMPNNGTGLVWPGKTVTTAGGDSGDADFTITRKDGVTMEININGAQTVQDILDLINNQASNHPELPLDQRPIEARLAAYGNGIELVDRTVGTGTLTVRRAQLSTAAIDLGLIPEGKDSSSQVVPGVAASVSVDSAAPKSDFVIKTREPGIQGNDWQVVFQDNSALMPPAASFSYDTINHQLIFGIIPGTTTAANIQSLLAGNAAANQVFEVDFDQSDSPPNDGSGVIDLPADPLVLEGGEPEVLTGRDVNPLETQGLFTALIRLQHALETNDNAEAERAVGLLDDAVQSLNFSRAELGARQQGLDILSNRLDTENVDLNQALSDQHDVDFVQVVSELAARQASFEASLRSTAEISHLSLLNYL